MHKQPDERPSGAERLAQAMFRFSATLQRERDALVRDLGLTTARWQLLEELSEKGGEVSTSALAAALYLTRQGVSRLLREIAEDGLVVVARSIQDRRVHLAAITDHGRSVLALARAREQRWQMGEASLHQADAALRALSRFRQLPAAEPAAPVGADVVDQPIVSPLGKRQPERAFEVVVQRILDDIRRGKLATGSKLPPERELAVLFEVGRSAVRESLRSLENAGVLRFERGPAGGAFVRESGPDGIANSIRAMLIIGRLPITDLLEVRSILIGQCARIGASRGDAEDFRRLDENIDQLEALIGRSSDQRLAIVPAMDFYRLASRTTKNPLLVLLGDAIADLVGEMLASSGRWPRLNAIAPRREAVAAMRQGRGRDAERVLQHHFTETNALLLSIGTRAGYERPRSPAP